MKYSIINLPKEFQAFNELSKREAELYFNWFIEQISLRLMILSHAITPTEDMPEVLDFSPESIKLLWDWFAKQIVWIPKCKLELELERSNSPSITQANILSEELDEQTLSLIFDISIYFGEVFIRNNPTIYWGKVNKPKSFVSVNRPVLLGFKNSMVLDPMLIVKNTVYKEKKENMDTSLYEMYNTWCSFI